jgi:hypothetical protein
MGPFGFDFWPKNAKARPNRLRFLRVSSPRVCGPRRIHGCDDSLKSSSRSAFPKNQRPSPPCPPSRLPTPSPTALDSSPICDSGAQPGLPSPAQAPALAPRFATPVRRPVPVARDSRADPLSAAPAGHPQRPCRRTRDP